MFGGGGSVAVELDGVDRGGDGAAAVASPLLLGLLVAEGLALCELEHVVGFLAPVAARSPLRHTHKTRVGDFVAARFQLSR